MTEQQKIRIGMILFPGLTQLDLTGPYEVLNSSPLTEIDFVWHRLEPVQAHGGMILTPTATFDDYAAPDVLFVPGGPGVLPVMEDPAVVDFVKSSAAEAKYITAVCTGSLLLAAAGVLVGKKATCHWNSIDFLELMGAIPVKERVVEDGNIITGAGVTSGIDFGLSLAATLFGQETAEIIQLLLEYDPAPPFDKGSLHKAAPETVDKVNGMLKEVLEKRREVAARIGETLR